MRRALAVAAVLVALATGCGNGVSLKAGKVEDKDHNAAWTSFIPVMSGQVMVMVPIFHEEEWELTVVDCEHRDKDGSCLSDEWNVDAAVFATIKEGDWVTRP